MKFTQVLYKHHLGRMIKRHWFEHGRQRLGDTFTEATLVKHGIEIVSANDLFKKPHPYPRIDSKELFSGLVVPRPLKQDESHPDWHEIPCYRYNNYDLLVYGTDQAQLLTKSLIVSNNLPDKIENLIKNTNKEIDELVTRIIYTSNIFDAQQVKLPIKKDPLRPAWVFPRDYGINAVRKSSNLSQKMIQLCESLCGSTIAHQRQLVHKGIVQLSQVKENNLLIFNSTMDMMLMSNNGLKPMDSNINHAQLTFPDIYPLDPIISLQKNHIYQVADLYPVSSESPWINLHTLFIYHDCENVKNLTEIPMNESQFLSVSLIKSFTAAASYAKQKYGNNVKDLPEPITIQCVHTNSQTFHFSVFQLNTLNIDGTDGKTNYWWSMPQMNLFEKAQYESGVPIVTEYNPEVFKRILAFYKNV